MKLFKYFILINCLLIGCAEPLPPPAPIVPFDVEVYQNGIKVDTYHNIIHERIWEGDYDFTKFTRSDGSEFLQPSKTVYYRDLK